MYEARLDPSIPAFLPFTQLVNIHLWSPCSVLRTLPDLRTLQFKVGLSSTSTQNLHLNKTARWFVCAFELGRHFKDIVPTPEIHQIYQRKWPRPQLVQTEQLGTFLKGVAPQMDKALWAHGLASGGVLCRVEKEGSSSQQSHPCAWTQALFMHVVDLCNQQPWTVCPWDSHILFSPPSLSPFLSLSICLCLSFKRDLISPPPPQPKE